MTQRKERLSIQLLLINAALAVLVLLTDSFVAALTRSISGG